MTLPFTLRQLEIFCAVVDTRSLSAAAEQLHAAQSSVSSAVGELERQLGQQLLIRRKAQGAWPTTAGRQLYRDAVEILREAAESARRLQERDGQLRGQLSIGVFTTLAPYVGPFLLKEFRAIHPLVNLQLVELPQQRLYTDVEHGHLDAAITYPKRTPGELSQEIITSQDSLVLLPGDHRFAGRTSLRLEELSTDRLIVMDEDPAKENTLTLLGINDDDARIAWMTPSISLVRSLVGHGLGISFLVQPDASPYSVDGMPVVEVPLAEGTGRTSISVLWRTPQAGRRPPRRVSQLVSFCQNKLGPHLAGIAARHKN